MILMKKELFRIFLLLTTLIVCFFSLSCRREEVSISQFLVQPYVKKDTGMGMSVYIICNINDEDKLKMQITDPSGDLVWFFEPERIINSGVTYLGSSAVLMPLGSLLPQGEWTFRLMYLDGRSLERKFTVSYRDLDNLLERSSSTNSSTSRFAAVMAVCGRQKGEIVGAAS